MTFLELEDKIPNMIIILLSVSDIWSLVYAGEFSSFFVFVFVFYFDWDIQ